MCASSPVLPPRLSLSLSLSPRLCTCDGHEFEPMKTSRTGNTRLLIVTSRPSDASQSIVLFYTFTRAASTLRFIMFYFSGATRQVECLAGLHHGFGRIWRSFGLGKEFTTLAFLMCAAHETGTQKRYWQKVLNRYCRRLCSSVVWSTLEYKHEMCNLLTI